MCVSWEFLALTLNAEIIQVHIEIDAVSLLEGDWVFFCWAVEILNCG